MAPFALIVVAVVEPFTPESWELDRVLAVAPALTAALWSVIPTLTVGLVTITFYTGATLLSRDFVTPSHFITLVEIATVTAVAAYGSYVRVSRQKTLSDVRSVAETAQMVLLRPMPKILAAIQLDVIYLAAAAEAQIGGDFYEAVHTPQGMRLIIGDVRGKGLVAVEVAAVILGSFREAAHEAASLPDLAQRLEASASRHSTEFPGKDAEERFATAVLLEIPDHGSVARLVNCGHPAPLLLHKGKVCEVDPSVASPPINMASLLGHDYHIETVPFTVGDQILLYTDGVSETRDQCGEFYPLTHRVRQWIPSSTSPVELLKNLQTDLLAYSASTLDDDVAVVLASRLPT